MKNLFKILFLSIVLTSFIKADDLLASLTNGKISDNSNGVKVLSLEEQKKIIGGIYATQRFYVAYHNNYGQRLNYTEYWQVFTDTYEEKIGAIITEPNGRYSTADYQSFKWFTSLDPQNEIVTLMGTYDFKTQSIQTSFVILNLKTMSHRYMDNHPVAQKILQTYDKVLREYVYADRYK